MAIYGTDVSRAIAALPGKERTAFVVGTQKLRGNNEVGDNAKKLFAKLACRLSPRSPSLGFE